MLRMLAMACTLAMLAVGTAGLGAADPAGFVDPYPNIDYYSKLNPDDFAIPESGGVWFTAAPDLNCGIWEFGSFGCAGAIPGAPAGTNHIGWFNGDWKVHYDFSVGLRWPVGQAQRALPPLSRVTHNGTTCAQTNDSGIYCTRGAFRFLITPTITYVNGYTGPDLHHGPDGPQPWKDLDGDPPRS